MSSDNWEPYGLWAPITGRLFLGVIKIPLAILLVWLTKFLSFMTEEPFALIVWTLIMSFVISEIGAVFIDRIFVNKAKHVSPGGKLNLVLQLLVILMLTFLVSYIMLDQWAMTIAITMLLFLITLVELVWLRAWEVGDSKEEFHEKWSEMKDMTKDTFEEDRKAIHQQARDKQRERYYKKKKDKK